MGDRPLSPVGGATGLFFLLGTSLRIWKKKITLKACRPMGGDRGYFWNISKRTYIFEILIFKKYKKEKSAWGYVLHQSWIHGHGKATGMHSPTASFWMGTGDRAGLSPKPGHPWNEAHVGINSRLAQKYIWEHAGRCGSRPNTRISRGEKILHPTCCSLPSVSPVRQRLLQHHRCQLPRGGRQRVYNSSMCASFYEQYIVSFY